MSDAGDKKSAYMDAPIVGVLGGMGPEATVIFYQEVTRHTKAARDQDHINLVILSYATMPDRTTALSQGRHDELLANHVAAVNMLKQAGAGVFVMTCNTAHILADGIVEATGLPIINMIERTAKDCASSMPGAATGRKPKVAILGTDGTVESGIYQHALSQAGCDSYTLGPENQQRIMDIIYQGIKAGKTVPATALDPIDREIREAGCDAAILGCTELSVFRNQNPLPPFYHDAQAILAREVIAYAGKEYV